MVRVGRVGDTGLQGRLCASVMQVWWQVAYSQSTWSDWAHCRRCRLGLLMCAGCPWAWVDSRLPPPTHGLQWGRRGASLFLTWGLGSVFRGRIQFSVTLSISLSLVTKSGPTLATPGTVARQAPPTMEFSRQEHWRGLPFPAPAVSIYKAFNGASLCLDLYQMPLQRHLSNKRERMS